MKRQIKRLLLSAGHYARRLRGMRFPGVVVLCYHGVRDDAQSAAQPAFPGLHVRASELEAHCRLLRESCHPISLEQWRAALGGGAPLPPRPVLVSFDDGYRSVKTRALPILARHAIPAVVFVASAPIQTRQLFWFDALCRRDGEAAVERAKTLAGDAWRSLMQEAGAPASEDDPDAPMGIEELRSLAAQPGIEIGGHTSSHPILARCSVSDQRDEIAQDKRRLEAWLGRSVTAFAYPNGRPGIDYTADSIRLVQELGYDMAFSTRPGFAAGRERHEWPRFLVLAGISPEELGHRLSYSWAKQKSASAS